MKSFKQLFTSITLINLSFLLLISFSSFADQAKKNHYKASSASSQTNTALANKEEIAKEAPTSSLPTPALIGPQPSVVILKEGTYIGLGGGYDSYKIREKIPLNSSNINAMSNPAINGTGLVAELFGGYGHYFNNNLYLGGEVLLSQSFVYQNANSTITSGGNSIGYRSKFIVNTHYGFSLLPGLKLNDSSLLFVRLGYYLARLKGQESRTINDGTPITNNTSNWSGGLGYGLGLEEAITDNFSLRGEYTHIDYRSFAASATSNTKYSPSNNQFMFSLLYHV